MKSPNFKTSAKMKGKNLFGSTQNDDLKNFNFFKKLNFDNCCDDKNNNFLGRKNNISNNTKDLFQKNNKLNIFLEQCDEEDEDNFNMNGNNDLNFLPSPKFCDGESDKFFFSNKEAPKKEKRTRSIRKCSINIESNLEILKTGKFENEFNTLKKIQESKFYTISTSIRR